MLIALLLAVAQTPPPPVAPSHVLRGTLIVHLVDTEGDLVLEDFDVRATCIGGGHKGARLSREPRDRSRGRERDVRRPQPGPLRRRGDPPLRGRRRPGRGRGARARTRLVRATTRDAASEPMPLRRRGRRPGVEGLQLQSRVRRRGSHPAGHHRERDQRYVARDVPPARYTVSVVDPRFRATSIEDVLTGEVARLTLVRCRAIVESALPHHARRHVVAAACARALLHEWTAPGWRVQVDSSPSCSKTSRPATCSRPRTSRSARPYRVRVDDLRHGERRELEIDVPSGHHPGGACRRYLRRTRGRRARADVRDASREQGHSRAVLPLDRARISRQHRLGQLRVLRCERHTSRCPHGLWGAILFTGPRAGPPPRTCVRDTIHAQANRDDHWRRARNAHRAGHRARWQRRRSDRRAAAGGLDPKELEFAFQFGSSSWLKPIDPDSLPVLDARGRIDLRGLPEETCSLVVNRRIVGLNGSLTENRPLGRITFLPKRGAPTPVTMDAQR